MWHCYLSPVNSDQRRVQHGNDEILLVPTLSRVRDGTVSIAAKEPIAPFPFVLSLDSSNRFGPVIYQSYHFLIGGFNGSFKVKLIQP